MIATLATCHCWDINKNQFPSCPSHISASVTTCGWRLPCWTAQIWNIPIPAQRFIYRMALFEEVQSRDSNLGLTASLPFFPAYLLPCTVQEWLPWCTYTFVYRSLTSVVSKRSWEQGGERRLTIKKRDSSWQEDQWGKQVVISETFRKVIKKISLGLPTLDTKQYRCLHLHPNL